MQQPFPPYNQSVNPGQSGHETGSSCGCGGIGADPHAGTQSVYPQHDQNQYQYYAPVGSTEYPQAYNMSGMPGSFASWFDFSSQNYLKGFIAGAGVTFLLTNPAMKRSLIKGFVSLTSMVQGGVEEVKEQVQDIKAEMSQKDQ